MRRQGVRKNHGLWKKEDADSAMPLDVFVQGVGGATPTPERPKSREFNLKGMYVPNSSILTINFGRVRCSRLR